MYGEITALCDKFGYCWAPNAYFAGLYEKSNDTISRWISSLASCGYIVTLVDTVAGNSRKIWLAEMAAVSAKNKKPIRKNADRVSAKMPIGYPQKSVDPIRKNAEHINTVISTGINTVNEGNTRREIENLLTLNTETQKGPTPNSAPPPSQFDAWLNTLTEDHRIREGFTITQKIPATLFPDYVTRFTALANTMPEKYHRRHDLTGHFLNWSRIQFQNESKKQNNGSQKFTFDLNKSLSEADEWLAQHNREMAAERAMRGQ